MHAAHRNEDSLDVAELLVTRRGLLRRSLVGITGVGLTAVLTACGDDEDEEPRQPAGEGAEDPGEEPGLGTETGLDAGDGGDEEDESTEEDD